MSYSEGFKSGGFNAVDDQNPTFNADGTTNPTVPAQGLSMMMKPRAPLK